MAEYLVGAEKPLKYDLKKSCPECPYTPKTKGWIGSHESAKEFHDVAKNDIPFCCHMNKNQSCVGNAIYMNKLCKMSIDPDKKNHQSSLRNSNEDVLFSFDGSKLEAYHGK